MSSLVVDDRVYAKKTVVNECRYNDIKHVHLIVTTDKYLMCGASDYDLYYCIESDKFIFRNSVVESSDSFISLLETYEFEFEVDACVLDALNNTVDIKRFEPMDGHCIYLI